MAAMIGAMILAAGFGQRMRPLSDTRPKPLLEAGGKPLVVWQIEALVRAGFRDIVVNAAHLADQLVEFLGDGHNYGVRLHWSREPEPLEVAGGIATALPLLPAGPALIVSGDLWTGYDYASLLPRAATMEADAASARVHLVMVPNPPYHPTGDFALHAANGSEHGAISLEGTPRVTYGNIGIYDTSLFAKLPRGTKLKLSPLLTDWIARGLVTGERYHGPWANVGTPDDLAQLDIALRHDNSKVTAR
jgi:MurNAc alpha-1-phosphate uridylyltransferase